MTIERVAAMSGGARFEPPSWQGKKRGRELGRESLFLQKLVEIDEITQ
jgi:hypothetical protein